MIIVLFCFSKVKLVHLTFTRRRTRTWRRTRLLTMRAVARNGGMNLPPGDNQHLVSRSTRVKKVTIFFTWTSSSKSENALDSANRITNGRQAHMLAIRKCFHVDLLRLVHSRPRRAVRNSNSYTIRKRSILALGIEALRRAQVAKCMFQSV